MQYLCRVGEDGESVGEGMRKFLGQGGVGEWWMRELKRKRGEGKEGTKGGECEYGVRRMYACVVPVAKAMVKD